jgi:hypothetical protein
MVGSDGEVGGKEFHYLRNGRWLQRRSRASVTRRVCEGG